VCEGETGIAGLICRYGYYGGLAPRGDLPPMLMVHGEKDMRVPAATARAFAEQACAVSSHPVSYAELPGAHHDFDLYESIRSAAVSAAAEQFAARVSAFCGTHHQARQPGPDLPPAASASVDSAGKTASPSGG
jgi:dienelactone hydrolase